MRRQGNHPPQWHALLGSHSKYTINIISNSVNLEFTDIPRTALVMGGDWNHRTPPEDLVLSPESKLRVLALGALGMSGLVDTVIFTAGLTRGPEEEPEATAQHRFLRQEFPNLPRMTILEETLGHTTRMDAIYTKDMVEAQGIDGPFTLITTEAFCKRQAKEFERQGFDIVPLAAESILSAYSPEHAELAMRYQHSTRHLKHMLREPILRCLQTIDPDSKLTKRLAARTRPNHSGGYISS